MLNKLTSLSSFFRLTLCLLLSSGLHAATVFYDWLDSSGEHRRQGSPVVVSLVEAANSFPAQTVAKPTAPKENLTAKAVKQDPRPKTEIAAKPIVKPPVVTPTKPLPGKKTTEKVMTVEEGAMSADLVCVTGEASEETTTESQQNIIQENPLSGGARGAAAAKTAANVMDSRADRSVGGDSSLTEPLVEAVPNYRNNPLPEYPYIARQKKWEGVVWLVVEVTSEGKVGDLQIEKTCGHKALDRAAVRSVKRWEFTPALKAGMPVESQVRIPVRFRLEDS